VRNSCAFPYRKAHARSCPALRGRNPGSFAFFAKGGIRYGRYRDSWYPTLREKREGPRISYCAAPAMAACAAFYEESRMRFVDPTKPYRKSGGMGHPGICCTFCRGQEMLRFLSRGSAPPVDDREEKFHFPALLPTSSRFGSKRRPPLSSRAQSRDLQFSQPASDSNRSAVLRFVI